MFKLTAAEAIELQAYLTTMQSNLNAYYLAQMNGNYKMVSAISQVIIPTPTLMALAERITAELEAKARNPIWVLASVHGNHMVTEDLKLTIALDEAKQFGSKLEAEQWYCDLPCKLRTPIHAISHVPA